MSTHQVLDAPQCLRILRSSSTALRLAWDPYHLCSIPDGGYEVELTNQHTGECFVHPVGHELWTEVYGLGPGCVYSARARAVCKACSSSMLCVCYESEHSSVLHF